jgi:hypothetical protein
MAKPEEIRSAAVSRKSLPLIIPTLIELMTTIKNISLGPSSMVPMMERPASGVR